MQFHHMALMVSNLDEAISLWRDTLGFELKLRMNVPDGDRPGPNTFMYQELLDDIFKIKDAKALGALLQSKEGALIELQEVLNPPIQRTPPESLRYAHTGVHELGLKVTDIDGWYTKIKADGYEMQTDYVWSCGNFGRSFLFYDKDGNMIQIWEDTAGITWN